MKDKHKDERKLCPKCGAVMGENIDGKPLCQCSVWPMKDLLEYEYALHHDPLIRIPEVKCSNPEFNMNVGCAQCMQVDCKVQKGADLCGRLAKGDPDTV